MILNRRSVNWMIGLACCDLMCVALLAMEAKRLDAAEPLFEWALQAAPDDASDTLLLWGGGLMAEDQFAKAVDARIKTRCIACPPDAVEDHYCCWEFTID